MAYVYKKTFTVYTPFSGEEYYDRKLHDDQWSNPMLDIEKLEDPNELSISAVQYATSFIKDPKTVGYQTRFGEYPQAYFQGKKFYESFCFHGKESYGELGHGDENLLTRLLWTGDGNLSELELYEFLASGDGPDESFSCKMGESPLEFNTDINEYLEIWPCSVRIEVAHINDEQVKWYSADLKDWNNTAAEGTMEVLLKEHKEMNQAVIPYFSTALEKHFRPFCLDPESLEFRPVRTQVGYAGILNYDGDDDYDENDDWDDEE